MSLLQVNQLLSEDLSIYNIAITAIILVLSLFIGAMSAGAEVALFTLQSKDVNYLKVRNDTPSIKIVQLIEQPSTLLSTIKSTKVCCSIIVILCTFYLYALLAPKNLHLALSISILLVVNLLLLMLVMEIIPKVYARQNNVRLAMFSVPFVSVMFNLFKNFTPTVEVEDYQSDRDKFKRNNTLPEAELKEAVKLRLGHEPTQDELDIFRGIMRFSEVTVRQVMQPRMKISGIREEWDITQVRDKVLYARFSRMPVYRGTVDHIIGFLYTKDLIPYLSEHDTDWHQLIRPVFYIHESKLIEDLFQEFQKRRIHVAVVVDEFGGTSGMVTLEDIMEEVVGEIKDEFDEEVLNFKKLDDATYIFDGKTLINDLCRIMGIDYNTFDPYKGSNSSIAGLVLEVAKRFPEVNEKIMIKDFEFQVLAIEKLHIERVKVKWIV